MVNANPLDCELRPVVLEALERADKIPQWTSKRCSTTSNLDSSTALVNTPASATDFSAKRWSLLLDDASAVLHHSTAKFTLAANAVTPTNATASSGSSTSSPAPDVAATTAAASSLRQPTRALRENLLCTVEALGLFPASKGKTLYQEAQTLSRDLLLNTAFLVNSFLSVPVQADVLERKVSSLGGTGLLWAGADAVKKLPRSNRAAVLKRWRTLEELLADAEDELDNEIGELEEGEDADDVRCTGWDDDEDEDDDDDDEDKKDAQKEHSELNAGTDADGTESSEDEPALSTEEKVAIGRELSKVIGLSRVLLKKIAARCLKVSSPLASSSSSSGNDANDNDKKDDEDDESTAARQDALLAVASELVSKVDDVVFTFGASQSESKPVVLEYIALFEKLVDHAKLLVPSAASSSSSTAPTATATTTPTHQEWFDTCRKYLCGMTQRWRKMESDH